MSVIHKDDRVEIGTITFDWGVLVILLEIGEGLEDAYPTHKSRYYSCGSRAFPEAIVRVYKGTGLTPNELMLRSKDLLEANGAMSIRDLMKELNVSRSDFVHIHQIVPWALNSIKMNTEVIWLRGLSEAGVRSWEVREVGDKTKKIKPLIECSEL